MAQYRPDSMPPEASPSRSHSGARPRTERVSVGHIVGGVRVLQVMEQHRTVLCVGRRVSDGVRVLVRLPDDEADRAGTHRILREASCKVSHPNLIKVLDAGVLRGVPYVVREHVVGLDLATVLTALERRGQRFSLPIAVAITTQVGLALQALRTSDAPLVYCGLDPTNVLISGKGEVKLLDLGDSVEVGAPSTPPHSLPSYVAPELLERKPVDESTDVYSLALLFASLLGGRILTESRSLRDQLAHALKNESPFITVLVRRATEAHRESRTRTLNEFLVALDAAVPEGADIRDESIVIALRTPTQSTSVPPGLRASSIPPQERTETSASVRPDPTEPVVAIEQTRAWTDYVRSEQPAPVAKFADAPTRPYENRTKQQALSAARPTPVPEGLQELTTALAEDNVERILEERMSSPPREVPPRVEPTESPEAGTINLEDTRGLDSVRPTQPETRQAQLPELTVLVGASPLALHYKKTHSRWVIPAVVAVVSAIGLAILWWFRR